MCCPTRPSPLTYLFVRRGYLIEVAPQAVRARLKRSAILAGFAAECSVEERAASRAGDVRKESCMCEYGPGRRCNVERRL